MGKLAPRKGNVGIPLAPYVPQMIQICTEAEAMPKKGTTNARNGTGIRRDGRVARSSAASALTQAPLDRSDRNESSRSRRTPPSADELALRAWEKTYKNSKGKDA